MTTNDYYTTVKEHKLKSKITDEFLETLTTLAIELAPDHDLIEIYNFVQQCHYLVDKQPPKDITASCKGHHP